MAKLTPEEKTRRLKLKTDIQRKINMANKRLTRLENNNLTNMSAYKNFVEYGDQPRFSVAGKNYNEVQQELSRLNKFLNNKSSLVRGANAQLKKLANLVGLDKKLKVGEINTQLKDFFETASKVEQYMKNVEGTGSSIGYHKIWEVINKYVKTDEEDFESAIERYKDIDQDLMELMAKEMIDERVDNMSGDIWQLVD